MAPPLMEHSQESDLSDILFFRRASRAMVFQGRVRRTASEEFFGYFNCL
jgi:hypothetical protein